VAVFGGRVLSLDAKKLGMENFQINNVTIIIIFEVLFLLD
jgi:hypothetical protein